MAATTGRLIQPRFEERSTRSLLNKAARRVWDGGTMGVVQGSSHPEHVVMDESLVRLLPSGSVYAFLAEHRRQLFPDAMFADLFPSHLGRPSVPAEVVATVLLLQAIDAAELRPPPGPRGLVALGGGQAFCFNGRPARRRRPPGVSSVPGSGGGL